jgi:hypothetical protein
VIYPINIVRSDIFLKEHTCTENPQTMNHPCIDKPSKLRPVGGAWQSRPGRLFLFLALAMSFIAIFPFVVQGESTVPLSQGWNFISFPQLPSDPAPIEEVFRDVSPNVNIIWGFDNANKTWLKHKPSSSLTLRSIEFGRGYWVYMTSAGSIDISSWLSPSSSAVRLYEGWNLIGYNGPDNADVPTAFKDSEGNWSVLWNWSGGKWYMKSANISVPAFPELTHFSLAKAYWLKVSGEIDGVGARRTIYAKDYADFEDAIAAAGSANVNIVVDTPVFLSANKAIPDTAALFIAGEGEITIGDGITLTFDRLAAPSDRQLFSGSGNAIRATQGTALPEWWGCKPDGITECAAAIRSALAAISATGGVVALQPGTYYLDSYDTTPINTGEYVVFAVPSNVELGGAPYTSSVKLSRNLQDRIPGERLSIIGTRSGTSGQIIRDINFDYNGITLDIGFRDYNAVRALGGKILLERLYTKNAPGRNMLVTSTNATIRDCTIINGSKNVPGNTKANDASFIYMMGTDNLVENCSFTNDIPAVTNCGGVEIHATNSKVINSTFNNLWPAIYTGVEDHSTIAYGNEISGNRITNSSGGISIIDRHIGLKIAGNYFKNNVGKGNYTIMTPRDNNTGVTGAGVQDGVTISDNTFDGMDDVSVAGLQNSSIVNNRWSGWLVAIELLGSTTPMKNVKVANNRFINPPNATGMVGQIQMDGSTNPAWRALYQDITIQENIFASASAAAPTHVYALVPAGHASYTTMTNVVFRRNNITNLTGKIGGNMARHVKEQ